MTREEAIKQLYKWGGLFPSEAYEALDMAIKALEDIERWRTWSHTYDNLIGRQDAIDAMGEEPEIWNDTEEEWAYRNAWVEHISALKALPSAEAEDRHYIKIYADDEPSVKAEKLYQICGETQNREVTEWLKEYFPSAEPKTGWIPCGERLPGEDELFYVLCCDKYGEIMIGNVFKCDDGETPYSAESESEYMYDCVAWMPLPEPYRKDGEV